MSYLDPLGAIFSLVATYYLVKANVLAWPASLLAVSINILLYYHVGLYGDAGLAIFYFISSLYGWYIWSSGEPLTSQIISITNITYKHAVILTIIGLVGISALYYLLSQYTDSDIALIDAITTIMSLIAQWLMCRKIIQTWLLWFIIDAINIGLYYYKGIPYHSALMAVYLVMALCGYFHWRNRLFMTSPA